MGKLNFLSSIGVDKIVSGSTCVTSPITVGSTCVCSPRVFGSTFVCSPVVTGSTKVCSPIIIGTTCVTSPIVCASSCARSALISGTTVCGLTVCPIDLTVSGFAAVNTAYIADARLSVGGDIRSTGMVSGATIRALTSITSPTLKLTSVAAKTTETCAAFFKSDGTIVSGTSTGGSGDVCKVGTPVDNQIGVWTGDGTIEGTTALTYDGTTFNINALVGIGAPPAGGRPLTISGNTTASIVSMVNGNAGGYGLYIKPGHDTDVYGLAISNAAGTTNATNHPVRMYGNGSALFTGCVDVGTCLCAGTTVTAGTCLVAATSTKSPIFASASGNVALRAGAEGVVCGVANGTVALYYDNAAKICTLATGACIVGNGCATDFISSSDCRLKKNIKPIINALSLVAQLQGVYYSLCDDKNNEISVGLIAQEVQKIIPEIVAHGEPNEDDKKYGITDDKLGLKYDKITAVLIEAIKEQQKQIYCLTSEINNLKQK